MRTKLKIAVFIGLLAVTACSDNEPENAPLSDAAKQYLSLKLGSNRASAESMSRPINQSFQGLFGASAVYNGRKSGDSTVNPGEPGDTTIFEDPWTS